MIELFRIPYRDEFSRFNRENFHCNAINCKAMKSLVKIYAFAYILREPIN